MFEPKSLCTFKLYVFVCTIGEFTSICSAICVYDWPLIIAKLQFISNCFVCWHLLRSIGFPIGLFARVHYLALFKKKDKPKFHEKDQKKNLLWPKKKSGYESILIVDAPVDWLLFNRWKIMLLYKWLISRCVSLVFREWCFKSSLDVVEKCVPNKIDITTLPPLAPRPLKKKKTVPTELVWNNVLYLRPLNVNNHLLVHCFAWCWVVYSSMKQIHSLDTLLIINDCA